MPVFYPSVVCNFRLRFDEAFHISGQPEPQSIADKVAAFQSGAAVGALLGGGNGPNAQQLTAAYQSGLGAGALAQRIKNPPPSVRPLILAPPVGRGTNQDNLSVVFNRVPVTAEVEIPGYRDAGRFTMSFKYRDLPIDPRIVRAVGIEIHMGAVDPSDFGTGMVSLDTDSRGQPYRRSILRTVDANGMPDETTLCMIGVADTWLTKLNAQGHTAFIEGRDLRGMLLDSPADPKLFAGLNLKKPIDDVVRQVLSKHPFGDRITVEVTADDWRGTGSEAFGPIGSSGQEPSPVLPSPATVDGVTRVNQGASGGNPNLKPPGATDQLNFWDLITRYCFLVGAIPYFVGGGAGFDPDTGGQIIVGARLRIRPARSIYDQQKPQFDSRIPTPFAGGKKRKSPGDNPDTFSIRRMVYGRDLEELQFERKFTGVKARVIECISLDTSSSDRGQQKLLVARWPQNVPTTTAAGKQVKFRAVAKVSKANSTSVAPSGAASMEEVLRIPVPGIRDQAQLLEIAKNLYEEIGRGEMGGSASTKNLSSFLVPDDANDKLAGNRDPDLVRMRPGDAVEILVDRRQLESVAPLVSSYTDSVRNSFDEEVAEIVQRMGQGNGTSEQNLARVIVATARNSVVELSRFFRVGNVKFNYDEGKLAIAFDYQNYIEVRSGVTPTSGPNQTAPTASAVGS